MSDREALKIFSRQPVNLDMINFLVSTTNSIIQVKPQQQLPSPASSTSSLSMNGTSEIVSINPPITLTQFIKNLIKYSNVQTPTLMATLVYLNKLRNYLPANAVGMETTRHRIFLSALIVAAKSLNDSSPLNKHWTKYTDGLMSLQDVNLAERELISILNWNITITQEELIYTLQPFLIGIKSCLLQQQELESVQRIKYYRLTQKKSTNSILSLGSRSSTPTVESPPVSSTSLSSSLYSSSSSSSSNYSLHNGVSASSSIASNLSQYEDVSPPQYTYKSNQQHQQHHNHHHKLPLSSTSDNNLNTLKQPSAQSHNQMMPSQIPISKSSKFGGQKDKNQYLAPIIKKKRSMMSLLTSSGKVVA
ncbi:PCL2 [Candida margitis]|uniref:PCL2 n=1 Tax=Candida margitis TaxID=1775924 RepID=UPI00222701BF|nr:PCL2 [Candida margitis]KAI5954131.1 PCL2 [Candida margitis]